MYYWNLLKTDLGRLCWLFILCVFALTGCAQTEHSGSATPFEVVELTPYLTITPRITSSSEQAIQSTQSAPTPIPTLTPTPLIYTVLANDTLTSIAYRYAVSLEDLVAANPGLDPNFLTIGLTLTIPLDGVAAAILPTPTALPLSVNQPACYPLNDGSLQCLAIVENDQSYAVENVIVLLSLALDGGEQVATEVAISPLNILPAGHKTAVTANFDAPLSPKYQSNAKLLTAIPISVDDQRYLQTRLETSQVLISSNGEQANVLGDVTLLSDQSDASVIWLAAFAYDEQKNIIGIRKWVADDILVSGERLSFDFTVYTFGPPIDHVELLVEARP